MGLAGGLASCVDQPRVCVKRRRGRVLLLLLLLRHMGARENRPQLGAPCGTYAVRCAVRTYEYEVHHTQTISRTCVR